MADNSLSRSQQLLADMDAKYGKTSSSAPAAPVVTPPVQPDPQPAAKKPGGMLEGAMNLIGNRNKQIDKAAGYSLGGKVGKRSFQYGGSTDGAVLEDDGAMAAGLGLIDQGRQQQAMAQQDLANKFAEIDGYACGGKPKPRAAAGAKVDAAGKISGPGTATSDSIPAKISPTGEDILVANGERIISVEQDQLLERIAQMLGFDTVDAMFEQMTGKPVGPSMKDGMMAAAEGASIYDPTYDALKKIPQSAFPNTMNAIQSGGDLAKSAADSGNYGAAIGQVGRGAIGGIAGLGKDVMNSAAYILDPAANALKTFVTGDSTPINGPSKQSINKPVQATQAEYGNEGRSVPSPITKTNPGAVVDNNFTAGGRNYVASPIASTEQANLSRVTSPGASPLYTNINPGQAVAGLNNQTIGSDAEGLARMANANRIRGEMLANRDKDIPVGGYGPGILGDGGVAADNAEKTQRWRNDELVRQAKNGNQAAIGALLNADSHRDVAAMGNETSRQNAGLVAQGANNRDQVTMRGQDVTAAGDMLRYNNPLDNREKQLKVAGLEDMAGLRGKALAGDPKAVAMINALSGKNPDNDRYHNLPNRKVYNDMGQVIDEVPGGLFDKQTGQIVQAGATQKPKQFTAGQTYTDANGNKAIYQKDGTWKEVK